MENTGIKAIECYKNARDEIAKLESSLKQNGISAAEILRDIDTKLDNFQPQIMLFGQYNAGKSTLLNALFGKEVAKTGDTPETYEVTPYKYGGYTIWDTPGLNAKDDHTKITDEHYKKCEVVIFVLSGDGAVENQGVYDLIKQVINDNKPIIVVYNNKGQYELDSREMAQVKSKILGNIGSHIDESQADKVPLIMLDAKAALEGRCDNDKELVEYSNIKELESQIEKTLKASGSTEVISTLNKSILTFISDSIEALDGKFNSDEIKSIENLISSIGMQKTNTQMAIKNICEIMRASLESKIQNIVFEGMQSKKEVDKEIESAIQDEMKNLERGVQEACKGLEINLQQLIENFAKPFFANPKIDLPSIDTKTIADKVNGLLGKINEVLGKIDDKTKNAIMGVLTAAIANLLPKLNVIIETISANPAFKAIFTNPAMQAAITASGFILPLIFEKSDKEKRMESRNIAEKIAGDVYEVAWKEIQKSLDSAFASILGELSLKAENLDKNDSELKSLKDKLVAIKNMLPIVSGNQLAIK
ncbi:hypothetical protein BKN38_09945 [Helicobacter sp. CLO-3]|uniref:dynamin family protein n=1 Tax=unclassified Helicobacter TaxID=2593540 RepID=UPI0008055580|nr:MULTISPECIES: dynamin family protein [unclassified Helicobacter]OBV30165.1 hypothetical protein BA723_09755 [Helicobacter sp. CLO-3]OHU80996.1 hypothetical protein BKN38_09945 [Helicobacter sp. CLO-3]